MVHSIHRDAPLSVSAHYLCVAMTLDVPIRSNRSDLGYEIFASCNLVDVVFLAVAVVAVVVDVVVVVVDVDVDVVVVDFRYHRRKS